MARKANENTNLQKVSEPSATEQLKYYENAIIESQEKSEGLAQRIAHALYHIDEKKLYKEVGFSSIAAYAQERFNIAKGTTSEAINTFKRFGDKITGDIDVKYRDYKFSTLIVMKSLSDKQIEEIGITPDKARSWVKEQVDTVKRNEKGQKALSSKIDEMRKETKKALVISELTDEQLSGIVKEAVGFDPNKFTPTEESVEKVTLAVTQVAAGNTDPSSIKKLVDSLGKKAEKPATVVIEMRKFFTEKEQPDYDKIADLFRQYRDTVKNGEKELRIVW